MISSGAAPTRRASETVGSNNLEEIGIKRKNAKILKNFYKFQMAYPVDSTRLLELSEYAIKNSNR
ncbi:hypothetical protein A2767_04800 [Candidatus Roizmanbacteria bacterium RIFCSPHIGHO2_01_FULL_35_10]|uniref:Uncharacterized protein n=1 Tax=Candidatus Roizmanbacteria bacterium RIFCSPLOWO2_01_FULL_35_13 TaxID=1802055 RepID=A0A1F7IAA3_9BACT|nr:MAG: hypothetical protein A2767_04800 [Candidatus Roizmanbacteria bacterium RIFCSPHIGHO2_01_FULL_35_10]OGK40286.1 MAG: hypothetical protein A3A74_07315 [Candidatus Roizmanbacteria bacterium RIFCSPLOWO2_01_FULL_35_13]